MEPLIATPLCLLQGWRTIVFFGTVLGSAGAVVFEAGRAHKTLSELEPKVKDLQTSVDTLRTDMRTDMDTLRKDMRTDMDTLRKDMNQLSQKIDALLMSFLPKPK